jgi:pimeloyl-ACP methyl ester carboxylesterase
VSNDPVLLLHGQPGAAADWDALRASIGPEMRTLAIDRPGWDGRSRATDLDGNARAALAELDRAGAARATVVGHSLGAAVAAWLASSAPDRVGRLVLIAPAANAESLTAFDSALAAPVLGTVASVAAMAGAGVALAGAPVRRWVAETTALDDRYLRAAGRVLRSPAAWRAFVYEQRALIRDIPALEARLGRLSAPATIISGSLDRVVPLHAARRLSAQIPGAELVVIAGARHLVHVQHADRVAGIVAPSRPVGGVKG